MTALSPKARDDNYFKRVDILTDVNVSILSMLAGNPMIGAMAGQEFVEEVQKLVGMLSDLRAETMVATV
jgi:hypothetical protein